MWEKIKTRTKQYLSSWTINFGLLLQMMAVVQTYVDGLGNPLATMLVGIVVVALRFKTNNALHEK